MGIIKNMFGKKDKKSDDDLKAAVFKKATDNMDAISEATASQDSDVKEAKQVYEDIGQDKKKIIRTVLLEIVERGEVGVLATSVSDKLGIRKLDASDALTYLIKNKYVDSVNSPIGVKFYLTEVGRKYCLSKEFNRLND